MAETNDQDKLSPKETELQTQVEQMKTQLQQEKEARESLLSDESIRKVMIARRDGKEVEVNLKKEVPAKSMKERLGSDDKELDINDLSNREFMDVLSTALEGHITDSISKASEGFSSNLETRFGNLEANQGRLHNALLKQAAAAGVTTLQSKHADFETYRKDTIAIMTDQNLGMEDAFLLAKARKGSTVPPRQEMESEHPGQSFGPRSAARSRNEPDQTQEPIRRRGSAAARFRELVDAGVDKTLAKRSY